MAFEHLSFKLWKGFYRTVSIKNWATLACCSTLTTKSGSCLPLHHDMWDLCTWPILLKYQSIAHTPLDSFHLTTCVQIRKIAHKNIWLHLVLTALPTSASRLTDFQFLEKIYLQQWGTIFYFFLFFFLNLYCFFARIELFIVPVREIHLGGYS